MWSWLLGVRSLQRRPEGGPDLAGTPSVRLDQIAVPQVTVGWAGGRLPGIAGSEAVAEEAGPARPPPAPGGPGQRPQRPVGARPAAPAPLARPAGRADRHPCCRRSGHRRWRPLSARLCAHQGRQSGQDHPAVVDHRSNRLPGRRRRHRQPAGRCRPSSPWPASESAAAGAAAKPCSPATVVEVAPSLASRASRAVGSRVVRSRPAQAEKSSSGRPRSGARRGRACSSGSPCCGPWVE